MGAGILNSFMFHTYVSEVSLFMISYLLLCYKLKGLKKSIKRFIAGKGRFFTHTVQLL